MPKIEEVAGKPDALYPTMDLLVQVAKLLAPSHYHKVLQRRAEDLQVNAGRGFAAEAKLMRVLQDGIDFGKWGDHGQ